MGACFPAVEECSHCQPTKLCIHLVAICGWCCKPTAESPLSTSLKVHPCGTA